MNWVAVAVLGYVTIERLAELWLARRNTQRLLAQGAREHGASHYPAIFAVHAAWIVTLWLLATDRGVDPFWLAMFVMLQFARFWVIATLGPRWTTRIIVSPRQPLVRAGPYRFLNHPNYWVVAGEIAVLPLVFGLPWVALAFTLLNAAVLWIRVREENRALA
ncbi:MAG TPA: isoprenylcysteine carboxylmethyltransferase family protein, partial [Sphingomicrobium sp.]|nr:isoprenylcysteine carboxylmethyltransferase family protein [Sphingomicrobium sp.]